MEHFLLLIVSICVSFWFFYKYKESQTKLKMTISKNLSLKLENSSIKTKMKYLETYKTDVSKTFKILDDELLLIKDNLTQNPQQQQISTSTNQQTLPRHRVSLLTPSVLTSLMTNETQVQPSQDVFNNIFNRFLTSNISNNDIELLRQQSLTRESQQVNFNPLSLSQREIEIEVQKEIPKDTEVQKEIPKDILEEPKRQLESIEEPKRQLESIEEDDENINILHSPNDYSKYLIN